MNQLIRHNIPIDDWGRKTLKQCLSALGFSKEEMRYRKGQISILKNWFAEEKALLDLVKKRWKEQVVIYHEANNGDKEKWKNVNSLYSAILKKIVSNIRETQRKTEYTEYECFICKSEVRKKVINGFELHSKLCKNSECKKKYNALKARRRRTLLKVNYEKICAWNECGKRFFTTNNVRKYCCWPCRNKQENKNERGKKRKYVPWREKMLKLTEEQRKEYNKKHYLKRLSKKENESPEQKKERRKKAAKYARLRWARLTPEQKKKDNCRSYALVYMRRGKLIKTSCQKCGDQNSQMHHPDYDKPLEVEWLCRLCHLELHKKQRSKAIHGAADTGLRVW